VTQHPASGHGGGHGMKTQKHSIGVVILVTVVFLILSLPWSNGV
jgi:hypothetical protein